jgi:hypothetical protein
MPFIFKEDTLLKLLVEQHGAANWPDIASRIDGRNNNQCRQRYVCDFTRLIVYKYLTYYTRWKNHVNPAINKEAFSTAEKALIFQGVLKNESWVDIAETLTVSKSSHRTPDFVKNFYHSSVKKAQGLCGQGGTR